MLLRDVMSDIDIYLIIHKYTSNDFYEKLIFFKTKDTNILVFLVRHLTIKMDIIKYYWYLCIYVTGKKPNFPERFRNESEYAETPS